MKFNREYLAYQGGFTLIELIMVIVILGILAVIIVPKYVEFTTEAEESTEEAFLGRLKTGIHGYGAERLIDSGKRYFPKVQSPLLNRVLDEKPSDWGYTQSNGRIKHTRKNGDVEEWYYWTNYDSTQFKIEKTYSGPPPPP